MSTEREPIRPLPRGSITSPRGFLAGATYAALKTRGDKILDLGLLLSERPCTATGLFTRNRIKAAPVVLCQGMLKNYRAQALVVNAGNANACTGPQGLADAQEMASLAARKLGLSPEDVLVASTGVIGVPLPLDKVRAGLGKIDLSRDGGHDLARAIMTTDTHPKEIAVSVEAGYTIGGIAKGAGMIHPNLATMLAFIATDAAVEPAFLEKALRRAVADSFNMITVDGDTSPNDTVLILANGSAGSETIPGGAPGRLFQQALNAVCTYLARSIAGDGEGASHLIEVRVEGAISRAQARQAARTIAGSSLVKAAVYGTDPNWGRIVAALGRSGAQIAERKLDIYLDNICLMQAGQPQPFEKDEAREILSRQEVPIRVSLNLGRGRAVAWGCDLSEEYVRINSAYTT